MKQVVLLLKEFVGLKPKMCSFLKDEGNKHKKGKPVNKNIVVTTGHGE